MPVLQDDPLHPGWQALLQALCTAAELPALRWVDLEGRAFEWCLGDDELQAFVGTISRCSQLHHFHLGSDMAPVWGNIFKGLSAVEHIKLVDSRLDALPESFGGLSALQELRLRFCGRLRVLCCCGAYTTE